MSQFAANRQLHKTKHQTSAPVWVQHHQKKTHKQNYHHNNLLVNMTKLSNISTSVSGAPWKKNTHKHNYHHKDPLVNTTKLSNHSSSSHAPPLWPAVANGSRQHFNSCLLQHLQPPLLHRFPGHLFLFLFYFFPIVLKCPSDSLRSFVVWSSFFRLFWSGLGVTGEQCAMAGRD